MQNPTRGQGLAPTDPLIDISLHGQLFSRLLSAYEDRYPTFHIGGAYIEIPATAPTLTQSDNKLLSLFELLVVLRKNVHIKLEGPHTKRPNASGIELIASGGMTPASVTTAVMLDGGVRSYNGLRISRLGWFWITRESGDWFRGKDENGSP